MKTSPGTSGQNDETPGIQFLGIVQARKERIADGEAILYRWGKPGALTFRSA